MTMTRERPITTKIAGDAGLKNCQAVAAQLRAALSGKEPVHLDLSELTSPDLTTVQLLLSAHRQAKAIGRPLTLSSPPQNALHDLLVQLGLLAADGSPIAGDADFWAPHAATESQAA